MTDASTKLRILKVGDLLERCLTKDCLGELSEESKSTSGVDICLWMLQNYTTAEIYCDACSIPFFLFFQKWIGIDILFYFTPTLSSKMIII